MNKTSLLMLVVGTILGIVIGYVTFSAKPMPPEEANIQAEGFRNINYTDGNFNIDIVERVDADNVEVKKNIQVPAAGFLKSYQVIGALIDRLVDDGVLAPPTASADPAPEE